MKANNDNQRVVVSFPGQIEFDDLQRIEDEIEITQILYDYTMFLQDRHTNEEINTEFCKRVKEIRGIFYED